MTDKNQLNEQDLNNVQGGNELWQKFSQNLLVALSADTLKPEYVELIMAIKEKDWILVQIKAIPLIATDPLIAQIYYETLNEN